MVRSFLKLARTQHRTSWLSEREGHERRQSCGTAIARVAVAAEPRVEHQSGDDQQEAELMPADGRFAGLCCDAAHLVLQLQPNAALAILQNDTVRNVRIPDFGKGRD